MRIESAKWALAALFLVDGVGFGFWASHVPVFKQSLHLSNGSLSVVLLSLVLGSIVTMPTVGHLIARFGSRTVIRIVAIGYVLMIGLLSQATNHTALMIAAALFGACKGALDVSVCSQAIAVEHHYGRSSMNLLQGFWSLGSLFGAASSSLLLRHGFSTKVNLSSAAIILGIVTLCALPFLVNESTPSEEASFSWPDSSLLRLSLLSFFGLFAEGALGDWAAVYLHSNIGVSLSMAAAGYATYAIAMTAARFAGGWITCHYSDKVVLRGSGFLVAFGFVTVLLSRSWPLGFVGLAFTGMGIANIVPVIMNVAGKDERLGPGPAISTVSTISYFGFLAGPPLIGWIAQMAGLQHALLLIVLAGMIVALGPQFVRFQRRPPCRELAPEAQL